LNSGHQLNRRLLLFGLWLVCSIAISWRAIASLLHYSLGNDDASHIFLIPIVSAWLIFTERQLILNRLSTDFTTAISLLIPGLVCILLSLRSVSPAPSACALGLVLLTIAGFAFAFGRTALLAARFPLMFLLLFIPLPQALLDKVVYFLQKGSAEISAILFGVTSMPVLREGFIFRLPRFSIEVARECSGIRSSIALFVLAVLVGHFFLHKFWKQVVFVLAGFVVMIIKNGIRIVTLTALANYVDPAFLYGNLHREGGVVFFMIGLLLLLPVFWILNLGEPKAPRDPTPKELPA
jgi:exosortase